MKFYAATIGSAANVFLYNAARFFAIFTMLNIGLGVFNLIPVPPFDGSRIINLILPEKLYWKIMRYERYIYWGVIAWMFLGRYVYIGLVSIPLIGDNAVLATILRIFDLSGLISDAVSFLYDAMSAVWQLIPFLKI